MKPSAPAKKPVVRRKNPLNKWLVYVGPQFNTKEEAIDYAQKVANLSGTDVHVYKA